MITQASMVKKMSDKMMRIEECKEAIKSFRMPKQPINDILQQLADTMRENEMLREALDCIERETYELSTQEIAQKALASSKHRLDSE